jgi:hypothetical protein
MFNFKKLGKIGKEESKKEIENIENIEEINKRRDFLSLVSLPSIALLFTSEVSASNVFLTSTSDSSAGCKCVKPTTIDQMYLKKTDTAVNSYKLEGNTALDIINKTLIRAKTEIGGFTGLAKEGHYKKSGSTIYMYVNGAWRQIFPAVYS